jgi:hypothetical protein
MNYHNDGNKIDFELLKEKVKQLDKLKEIEKKEAEELENQKKQLELKNHEIKKLKDKYENIEENKKLEKDPLEFYDIIVDINSIQNIKTDGWKIYMNEKGKKISDDKDNIERLVIGVMGNRNKGKSFMLQALSGEDLQTGTSISTIGLSIKYSENKFVLLDCAGSESPLLGEHANMLEISRDKLFTEAFLESYILRKSNVLLLVIGILSFSEQKLINKIGKDLEKLKKKEKKNLIIIHNLQTYETVEQVEKYIKDTLVKSASFKIKKDESNFDDETEASEYFFDIDNNSIKHFIYAKENSIAGEKYNKRTINAIKSLYKISTNKYKYDYKETIIEHFQYMGEKMFDLIGKTNLELTEVKENEEKVIKEEAKENKEKKKKEKKEDNVDDKEKKENENEENKEDNVDGKEKKEDKKNVKNELNLIDKKLVKFSSKLIFKGEEKLVLQKMVIDELGISSFIKNDFNPDYEMYYDEKELILTIESPEGVKLSAKRKRNKNGEYPFGIEIKGEKVEAKVEKVKYIKSKQCGKFYALIPFTDNDYSLEKGTEEEPKNGWKTFRFKLSKVEDDDD